MRGHPLSDEYLCAVGDIVVAFNYLERNVQQIFQTILSPNLAGRVICAKIGFRQLREFTLAVYQSVYGESDEDYKVLESLFSEIEQVEEERNRVAHCVWSAGSMDVETRSYEDISSHQVKLAKKRALRYDFKGVSVEGLSSTAERIRLLWRRVVDFDMSHYERRKYMYVKYDV